MADIYGSHFEYGGITSRQYSLVIANINTTRQTQLSGVKEGITIFNKNANKRYLIDDDYSSSPISFDIEIITESGRRLEYFEQRQIEKWLFGFNGYRKLYLDIANDERGETYEIIDGIIKRNYLNCRFINPEKLEYNGGIVGYKMTLEADSNMFWQDSITKKFEVNNDSDSSVSVIELDIDTDLPEYIYPKVTITMGTDGGDITISNNSDDSTRLTSFTDVGASASIIMKGELNYISGQYYEKFYNRNFIRLLDGENKFTLMGNIKTIEFEYSVRRVL